MFNLITINIHEVTSDAIYNKYPELFTGLGTLPKKYHIELKPNAIPFAVKVARNIPIPLPDKVRAELQRM